MPSATRFGTTRIQDTDDYAEALTWAGQATFLANILQASDKWIATDEIRALDNTGLRVFDDGGNGLFVGDGGQVAFGHLVPETAIHLKSATPELRLEHTVDWESPILSLRGSAVSAGKIDLGTAAALDNVLDVKGMKSTPNTYIFVKGTGGAWNAGIRFALSHLSPTYYGAVGVDQDDNVYLKNSSTLGGGFIFWAGGSQIISVSSAGIASFSENILQADGKYISTDQVRARNGDGLKLYDDGGNGIFVKDGGNVGVNIDPQKTFHIADASAAVFALEDTGAGADEKKKFMYTDGGFLYFGKWTDAWAATTQLTLKNSGEFGVNVANPAAQTHIDQANTTAAIPVLLLDQADIDQPTVKIVGTAEVGSADRTLVAASDFTTPGAIVAWEMVYAEDIGNRFPDAKYWRPLYAIPTA